MLGLLALNGVKKAPALVGIEEPENGVHPRRVQLIAEFLRTRENLTNTQYIVTTHSPILPDKVSEAIHCSWYVETRPQYAHRSVFDVGSVGTAP